MKMIKLILNEILTIRGDPDLGVLNGPIQLKSAHKIWPLLELLAKIRWVLACSCSQKFWKCSHAWIFITIPCHSLGAYVQNESSVGIFCWKQATTLERDCQNAPWIWILCWMQEAPQSRGANRAEHYSTIETEWEFTFLILSCAEKCSSPLTALTSQKTLVIVERLSMGQLFITGPSLITPNWKSSSVNIKQYSNRMHKTIHLKECIISVYDFLSYHINSSYFRQY